MRLPALASIMFTGSALMFAGFVTTSISEQVLTPTPRFWSVAAGVAVLAVPFTHSLLWRATQVGIAGFAMLLRSWYFIRDLGFTVDGLVPLCAWMGLLFAVITMVTSDAEKPLHTKVPI